MKINVQIKTFISSTFIKLTCISNKREKKNPLKSLNPLNQLQFLKDKPNTETRKVKQISSFFYLPSDMLFNM